MRHQTTLRFIDAIARAGSIRRAAEKMAITPSALNRRLLAVEEEFDVQLFERMATGVRLSAAGELFLAHARRQMADMERIRSQIEDMKGARRGHVSFGFDDGMAMDGCAEAVGLYRDRHPEVTFSVERVERNLVQQQLSDYRHDLACVVQPEFYPHMTTLAVAPLQVSAIVDEQHPLSSYESVKFNDVLPYPLVLPMGGSLRELLDAAARRQDFELRPLLECELPLASHTLAHSRAVGFSVNIAKRKDALIPGMTAVPLDARDLKTPNLHLVQLKGRALSVAAGRFADMLVQTFAGYAGEM